jgi:DNA-binding phage protein
MTQIARQTGLSRESLYKALSGDRSPSFDTALKVGAALGLKLSAGVQGKAEAAGPQSRLPGSAG